MKKSALLGFLWKIAVLGLAVHSSGCMGSDDTIVLGDESNENKEAQPAEAPDEPTAEVQQSLVANKGIILIDRTGSMTATRSTGYSRCRDARQMALNKVDEFFGKYYGSALSVWTFNGTAAVKLTGYVSAATAKSAINNLPMEGCTNITPLADAICKAADELYALRGTTTNPNLLTILTDGGENASTGACAGNSNDQTDPASWRYKARQRVAGYLPYVQVNPQFWTGSTFVNLKGMDPETGKPLPQMPTSLYTCSNQEQCDHTFLYSLAADTGGTYDLVKDSNTQFPCTYLQCPPPYYEPIDW